MTPKLAVVILAAGASTRMGVPKQLLPWGDSNLISHVIHIATCLKQEVHVILGAHAQLIKAELPEIKNLYTHINPNWKEGIGDTIAYAANTLREEGFDGMLFLLADQPFVPKIFIKQIQERFIENTTSIIVSEFNENLGVPVLFPSEYFKELAALSGDVGAKRIIKKYLNKAIRLNAEPYVRDIDTLSDYQNAYDNNFKDTSRDLS